MATIRDHTRIDRSPDEDLCRFRYRIAGGDMPVEFRLGTVDVLPNGDGSLIVHPTDIGPDEVAGQMNGILAEGLQGPKAHLESEAISDIARPRSVLCANLDAVRFSVVGAG